MCASLLKYTRAMTYTRKKILITIPNGAVSHGFLRTSFLSTLLGNNVDVVLIVPPYRKEYYEKEFDGNPSVQVQGAPIHRYKRFEDFANRFLRQSIPSRTIRNRQWHAFHVGSGFSRYITFAFTRSLWLLGHIRTWRYALRFCYSFTPCAAYMPLIDTYKPDVVFVTTLYDRMDLGLMKAAKKRHIPIVAMTKSWDSITSKCFMAVHPDRLLVQNEVLAEDAVIYADMRRSDITVCGVPQFDFYFKENILWPRDVFLQKVGLSSAARYVLFGGEGLDLFPGECEVLRMTATMMQNDSRLKDLTLLYRPHPNYEWCEDATRECPNIVIGTAATRIENTAGGWEFELDDIRFLVNSIYHADMLVTMASTLVIEAALFNRPLIGIAFDGMQKRRFYASVERFYHTNHFANIVKTKGIRVARGADELHEAIVTYVKDPSLDTGGRKEIQKQQVPFVDGNAGPRVAHTILRFLDTGIR